jgi:hypothetical protein
MQPAGVAASAGRQACAAPAPAPPLLTSHHWLPCQLDAPLWRQPWPAQEGMGRVRYMLLHNSSQTATLI